MWRVAAVAASAAAAAPSGFLLHHHPPPHAVAAGTRPNVSWIVPHVPACGVNQLQQAYQIQLSGSPEFSRVHADSGKVSSAVAAAQLPGELRGPAMWYRVRTWEAKGCASEWSEPAKVLRAGFSSAVPVWADGARYAYVRKVVSISKPVSSAHVCIAAAQDGDMEKLLGAYRLFINGEAVSTGPGRGDVAYSAANHTTYDTVDVTKLVQAAGGEVVVAVQGYHHTGDAAARLIAEISVMHTDGSTQVVGTNSSWSALGADSVFNPTGNTGGDFKTQPREYIDARSSPAGDQTAWRRPGFDAAGWTAAAERPVFSPPLLAKTAQAVRVTQKVVPAVTQVGPGHWFCDFGREVMAGIELVYPSGVSGRQLDLRMSEELTGNASILYPMRTKNTYQMTWTLAGGRSTFEQHEYFEFRYGEVRELGTCVSVAARENEGQRVEFACPASHVISEVLFASYGRPEGECLPDGTNTFSANSSCSAAGSARVVERLCVGKQDCSFTLSNGLFGSDPCRGSSKGFSGQVRCKAAGAGATKPPFELTAWVAGYPWTETDSSFNSSSDMLNDVWSLCRNTLKYTTLDTWTDSNTRERRPYEADGYVAGGSRYYLQREYAFQRHSAVHNGRNPTWPTEWRQIIPLYVQQHYMMTGDAGLAVDLIDVLNVSTQARCISPVSGLVDFTHCPREAGTRDIVDWPQSSRDGYVMTDVNTVVNAHAAASLRALSQLLEATGDEEGSAWAAGAAERLSAAIVSLLHSNETGLFVDGLGETHSAWHAQVYPIAFGIGNASDPRVLAFLKTKRMAGSVYGAFAFLKALYRMDGDFGMEMMTNCDSNSWCHMLRVGATATMEAWTREEKPNLSWSHPWATAPVTAITTGLMGITPVTPAWRKFEVRPRAGGLAWAEQVVPTVAGFIRSRFDADASGFTLRLCPPANTEASVCLPSLNVPGNTLVVDGADVEGYRDGGDVCVGGVGSGERTIQRRV